MDITGWSALAGVAGTPIAALGAWIAWKQRHRPSPDLRVAVKRRGKSEVVNVGDAPARDLHIRVGSASNADDNEDEKRVASLGGGEVVLIEIWPTHDSASDLAVVMTWRGRFGRRQELVHPLL